MCCLKGGIYALDDFCDTRNTLAAGFGQRVYNWRLYPYPPCNSNRCGAAQGHIRTQTDLMVGIKEGSAGMKEVKMREDILLL